jgi:hypothetical protein
MQFVGTRGVLCLGVTVEREMDAMRKRGNRTVMMMERPGFLRCLEGKLLLVAIYEN